MKLALDACTIFRPQRRGTGKNLIDLYRHLACLRGDWRIVMFHRGDGADNPFADLANIEPRRIDIRGDRWGLWQQLRLPLAAWRCRADVLHCPANTAPKWSRVPRVVTIHDLIPTDRRFCPDGSPRWAANVAAAARKAAAILTPSGFTAEQITRRFGVSADKVTVNFWAPDSTCRKVDDAEALVDVRRRYGLATGDRYVLAFGGADPRKNTVGILAAWAAMPRKLRNDHRLLVIGVQSTAMAALQSAAASLDIADTCRLGGFADEADMPALISGAEVLCYASLSEGFGLPILDAFICETAVLTGDVTSLPEVAGDAAWLVDPADPGSIADGLAALLSDEARRADLIARGRERVKRFTWDATARRAAEVFQRVAG